MLLNVNYTAAIGIDLLSAIHYFFQMVLDGILTTQCKLLFAANSPSGAERSISFPIYDDTVDEEPEGFIIVLYRDTNLTSIEVAFTVNLRTTLGRINDE